MIKPLLLVEDDANDIFFLKFAMESAALDNPLRVVEDGKEAIDYLSGEGRFANREAHPLPHLVLLDLRLPRISGFEVLKWIREQSHFASLPVIILTTSPLETDVEKAYALGASSYVVKPTNPITLIEILKCIKRYWLDMDHPPKKCKDWEAVSLSPRALPGKVPSLSAKA